MGLENTAQAKSYIKNYVEDFLVFIESKGSDKTSDAYIIHLNTFANVMFGCDLDYITEQDLQSIDAQFVLKYRQTMYLSGEFKNGTINNKMTALRKFLRYMQFREVITHNFKDDSEFLIGVKNDTEHYDTITMDMVPAILELVKKERYLQVEKEWFIKIAIETGLRAQDILGLTKDQFIPQKDGIHVLIKSSMENKGKGNEDWKDLIHINFFEELKAALFIDGQDKLFTLDVSTMRKRLQAIIKKLGYEGNYVLHSLKRTAVNNTNDTTGDLYAAQMKGKHKNTSTTVNNYLDEVKYGATGYYSMQHKVKEDYISQASHEDLLKAIDGLDENVVLLIQMKLQQMKEGK